VSLLAEVKSLRSEPRDLRKFGLTVGGVFALLGLWFLYRHKSYAWYCLAPGLGLMALGLLVPRMLRPIFFGWMTVGLALGMVVSSILLTLLFYVIVMPIGLAARVMGKDFLSLRLEPNAPTYWGPREAVGKTKTDYEKQY
jgi:hypothetical protein